MERIPNDKPMQQTHRPVSVVNPYLRNRTMPASSSSMMKTTLAFANIATNGKVEAATISSAGALKAATTTPKPDRSSNHTTSNQNPYHRGGGGKNIAVTPTPKKQPTNTTVSVSSKSSIKAIVVNPHSRQAPNSARAHSEQVLGAPPQVHHATQTATAQPKVELAPRKKQPSTLKSQLKSQIAQLHRQKRLFLEKKEAEKQRLLREQEKERQRIEREKEMKRIADIKEQERKKMEDEKRRKNVGYFINDLVKIVERRIEMEQKYNGAHYAIGETMEYMVKSIESKERKRLKTKREHQHRVKEIKLCLMRMIHIVEHKMQLQATGTTNAMGDLASMQQQQQQKQSMMMNYPFFHYQAIPSYGMLYPPIFQSTMMIHNPMIQGGYNPHFSHHRPQDMSFPLHSATLPHTLNETYKSQILPPNAGNPMIQHSRPQPAKSTLPTLLHSSPVTDPYSPYFKSHHVLPADILLTKESAGESFGVTLRFECKSVLVPNATEGCDSANSTSALTLNSTVFTEEKHLRKRVNYGVMAVVDASKAKFALKPGDIILAINSKPCGGLTFTEACRAIGAASTVCPSSGLIQCVLKVARMNAITGPVHMKPSPQISSLLSASRMELQSLIPVPPTESKIPFHAIDGAVKSGEFTTTEWAALIRGLSEIPFQLFRGLALVSVTQREALASIMKSDKYGKSLRRRSREALEEKLALESRRVIIDMQKRAAEYWARKWEVEQQQDAQESGNESLLGGPLTDAQRSALREAARPAKGCKCGSSTHEFVSNINCPLYRDVRQYCETKSINYLGEITDARKKSTANNSIKTKNSMVKAYIDRFLRLREEKAADREEAEFVIEMEKIQVSKMKKAVLVSPSLCNLVLSAVASVMGKLDDGEMKLEGSQSQSPSKNHPEQSDSDASEGSDDDEAVPLNSLVQTSLKRAPTNGISPLPLKRPKTTEQYKAGNGYRAVAPSPYFIAEILNHVSATYGHLFQGKTQCITCGAGCNSVYFLILASSFYYHKRTFTC